MLGWLVCVLQKTTLHRGCAVDASCVCAGIKIIKVKESGKFWGEGSRSHLVSGVTFLGCCQVRVSRSMMNGKEQTYLPIAGSLEPFSPTIPPLPPQKRTPGWVSFAQVERKEPGRLFVGKGGAKETIQHSCRASESLLPRLMLGFWGCPANNTSSLCPFSEPTEK